jgi:hypothetical protein
MKKRQFYLVLNKKNRYTYGAFPRTKEGRVAAMLYKRELKKKHSKTVFVVT